MAGKKIVSLAAALYVSLSLPAMAAGNTEMDGAVAKYNAKDYQGALNGFKSVYSKDAKNSLARYYMALCNQCLARVEEAKKDYKWVIDNGAPSLKGNAQTGLSQLEKVGGRTGGSASTAAATPAPAKTATSDSGKPGNDLIDRSGTASGTKDGKDSKDAKDPKATAAAGTKPGAAPAAAEGAVAKVINFYSDAARDSQLMEPAWDEVKGKYPPKIQFTKVNSGDPLCEKYNIGQFPSIVILDKNGKALQTLSGPQSTEQIETAINTANKK